MSSFSIDSLSHLHSIPDYQVHLWVIESCSFRSQLLLYWILYWSRRRREMWIFCQSSQELSVIRALLHPASVPWAYHQAMKTHDSFLHQHKEWYVGCVNTWWRSQVHYDACTVEDHHHGNTGDLKSIGDDDNHVISKNNDTTNNDIQHNKATQNPSAHVILPCLLYVIHGQASFCDVEYLRRRYTYTAEDQLGEHCMRGVSLLFIDDQPQTLRGAAASHDEKTAVNHTLSLCSATRERRHCYTVYQDACFRNLMETKGFVDVLLVLRTVIPLPYDVRNEMDTIHVCFTPLMRQDEDIVRRLYRYWFQLLSRQEYEMVQMQCTPEHRRVLTLRQSVITKNWQNHFCIHDEHGLMASIRQWPHHLVHHTLFTDRVPPVGATVITEVYVDKHDANKKAQDAAAATLLPATMAIASSRRMRESSSSSIMDASSDSIVTVTMYTKEKHREQEMNDKVVLLSSSSRHPCHATHAHSSSLTRIRGAFTDVFFQVTSHEQDDDC